LEICFGSHVFEDEDSYIAGSDALLLVPDVSKEGSTLNLEDEETTFLRNVRNQYFNDATSHPRKSET
jgi:hypothetical protein